jgi:hypothetical protein
MLKNVKFLVLPFILFTILLSCKREHPNIEHLYIYRADSPVMKAFFDRNGVPSQQFVVNSEAPIQVIGQKGSKFYIEQNAFVTSSGNNVIGDVTIELQELFDKKDFILSNKPTETTDFPLISAGSFYINASQNGNDLLFKANTSLVVRIPTQSASPQMQMFTGKNVGNRFVWEPVNSWSASEQNGVFPAMTSTVDINDSAYYGGFSFYERTDLSWINCDEYYNVPYTKATVESGNSPSYENTVFFIVIKNENTVLRCYSYPEQESFEAYALPIGYEAYVVGICEASGRFYLSKEEVTISSDMVHVPSFTELTEAELIAQIEDL